MFSPTTEVKLTSQVNTNSPIDLTTSDKSYSITTPNINKFSGLLTRCIDDKCILPTVNKSVIDLVHVLSSEIEFDPELIGFTSYIDMKLEHRAIEYFGGKFTKLFVPIINYDRNPPVITDDYKFDKFKEIGDEVSLSSHFVEPVFPSDVPDHLYKYYITPQYLPHILTSIKSPQLMSYAMAYLYAHERYASVAETPRVHLFTDEYEHINKKEFEACWYPFINQQDLIYSFSAADAPTVISCLRPTPQYEEMIKLMRDTINSHPCALLINHILDNKLGVITGGFIAGVIFGSNSYDIDICLYPEVDIFELGTLLPNNGIIGLDIQDQRITVDCENNLELDIFKSKLHPITLISNFHFSCVRAFYDGDKLYMFPSCMLTILNGGLNTVNIRFGRLSKVYSYLVRGFKFLQSDIELMKIFEGDEFVVEGKLDPLPPLPNHYDKDGNFMLETHLCSLWS